MCDPAYLAWCEQQGISMHGVQPAFVSEGWRGVVATQELLPGDVVMRVPQQLLMSALSAQQDPQLSQLLQQHQLSSHQVLTVHLLHEASKGPASRWWPYLTQLPPTYTTCANWQPAAVEALQAQHARAAAAAAVARAQQDWTHARPLLQQLGVGKKWCSWRAWQWAASAVLSRTMYHPADPPCGCLTPLGDLHNYAPPLPTHTPQLGQDLQQLIQQQQQQQRQQGLMLVTPGGTASAGPLSGSEPAAAPRTPEQQQQQQAEGMLQQQQQHADETDPQKQPQDDADSSSSDSSSTTAAPASSSQAAVVAAAAVGAAEQQQEGGAVTTPEAQQDPQPYAAAAAAAEASGDGSSCLESPSISGDGHFDATEGCYKIVARKRYAPGDQVFLCYGRHTNLELLVLYGFLLPHNPHDTALLPHQLLQQHLQQALQQQQQQQHQGAVVGRRVHCRHRQQQQQGVDGGVQLELAAADCWVHAGGQPGWQLLSALRSAAACVLGSAPLSYKALSGEPVSLASEAAVLAALAGACRAQLAALPTSRQQDMQLLASLSVQQEPQPITPADDQPAAAAVKSAGRFDTGGSGEGGRGEPQRQQQESMQQELLGGGSAVASAGERSGSSQQQQRECVELAVRWRLGYKASLLACAEACEGLLDTAREVLGLSSSSSNIGS